MRRLSILVSAVFSVGMVAVLSPLSCGGSSGSQYGHGGDGGGTSGNGSGGTAGICLGGGCGGGSAGSGGTSGSGGKKCPPGLKCDVSCAGGGTTTITGTVYDPALRDPIYNVAVYVPENSLTPLPAGVPTGKDACSCGALFASGAVVNTTTAVDGTFTLKNVPVSNSVPLVIQVGKWRRQFHIDVKECQDNAQPDKSLALPNAVAAGDTDTNMPDIAVSTGGADTLECLMTRIGLPPSEYVPGTATGGHVHVFSGGGGGVSQPEQHVMPGAPVSSTSLWASQAQLMPYDILLLSCEGGETLDANPPALESYLNVGGRAFASHYHYAWFSGSLGHYPAPADWGTNLATWTPGSNSDLGVIGGSIDQTLNGSTAPFPKGIALAQWLKIVNGLGAGGVPPTELSIYESRYNAVVGPANKPSQPWIIADANSSEKGDTMYFSFDTPVGSPNVCGRAVFSGLHVDGDTMVTNDTENSPGGSPPPTGCDTGPLSPQEKALEFMLFDLSSCVIPDSQPPSTDGGLPPPPR